MSTTRNDKCTSGALKLIALAVLALALLASPAMAGTFKSSTKTYNNCTWTTKIGSTGSSILSYGGSVYAKDSDCAEVVFHYYFKDSNSGPTKSLSSGDSSKNSSGELYASVWYGSTHIPIKAIGCGRKNGSSLWGCKTLYFF